MAMKTKRRHFVVHYCTQLSFYVVMTSHSVEARSAVKYNYTQQHIVTIYYHNWFPTTG